MGSDREGGGGCGADVQVVVVIDDGRRQGMRGLLGTKEIYFKMNSWELLSD